MKLSSELFFRNLSEVDVTPSSVSLNGLFCGVLEMSVLPAERHKPRLTLLDLAMFCNVKRLLATRHAQASAPSDERAGAARMPLLDNPIAVVTDHPDVHEAQAFNPVRATASQSRGSSTAKVCSNAAQPEPIARYNSLPRILTPFSSSPRATPTSTSRV